MAISGARVIQTLRDAVVPPLCVVCLEPELSGNPLCGECSSRLAPAAVGAGAVWSAFEYEGVARDLVHSLKTRMNLAAAAAMAAAIVRREPPLSPGAVLVPVPAHADRRRRHGFNHAAELARGLARKLDGEVRDVLARVKSQHQTGRARHERITNICDTVVVKPGTRMPASVALIDDVYTTGATLGACAAALRAAGTEPFTAITFARAGKY